MALFFGRFWSTKVCHGHTERKFSVKFHVKRAPSGLHHGRIDKIRHGARIMHGRIHEVLIVLIGLAEEIHESANDDSKWRANLFDAALHFRRAKCLMRKIEPDHGQFPGGIEHDMGCFGFVLS